MHLHSANVRVSQGLVVTSTDSATPDQERRYRTYAKSRYPRTWEPQGGQRRLLALDRVGSSDEIATTPWDHSGVREVEEVAFALPLTCAHEDGPRVGVQDRGERRARAD